MRTRIATVLALALLAAVTVQAAGAATITIINTDGAGEGFNDPTAVAPVGGNPGVTLGQQRLNVFQQAANIWGALLPSAVTIRVQARFDAQFCNATSAVLGSAGAIQAAANFPSAEFANTLYHVALANRIAGFDLSPGTDDITATFNSTLDSSPTCLGGIGWYYGFDGNEGSQIDLLPVVLHELGHGLGFSTFTNLSTGALASNTPDIYCRNILDTSTGEHWHTMTNAERVASAINTGNVVWDGTSVRGHAPSILGLRRVVEVNAPGAIAGVYLAAQASFGPALTEAGLTGNVVQAVDPDEDGGAATFTANDGCSALTNGAAINGNIALIDRGACTFSSKVKNAQNAGAIGVIIVNNVASVLPPSLGGSDPTITIPAVSVTQATGNLIKAQLGAGVNVTLRLDPPNLAGADDENRVFLYAPNPLETGSSISHWDVSATPNLLMEPAINSDLGGGVDLTEFHFEDIGWFGPTTPVAEAPPRRTRLLGNAPNPFNPVTTVAFELARAGRVRLAVYDLAGRLVKQLVSGELSADLHRVTWDGTDAQGHGVASGLYLTRLETADGVESGRMVLLK